MVRQPPSAPGALNRSVVFYVRIQSEDVSRRMPYQPRPLERDNQPETEGLGGL
jgi:hypothetical protein